MNRRIISVVIPTYNRASTLIRSVNSVLFQTYPVDEIIIVDDCSSDNTEEIVASIDDARVKYLRHSQQLGGNAARNTGIDASSGDYIAFQDSDDEWSLSKLEIQFRHLDSLGMDYGLCFCSYLKIVGDEFVIVPSYNISNAREQIGKSSFISTQTMIVRSDILKSVGGFDQRLPKLQDWDLVLRLAEVTKFAYLNIPLALVYETPGSISSFKENEIPAREIILSKIEKSGYFGSDVAAYHSYVLSRILSAYNRPAEYRKFAQKAFRMQPLNLKYSLNLLLSYLCQKRICKGSGSSASA